MAIYGPNYDKYILDQTSNLKYAIDEVDPHFYINGHEFNVSTNAESKPEINLVENKMFVPGKSWGYTDIQWTNFSGTTLDLEIFSRTYDEYKGDPVQPANGGISSFYDSKKTPHAVLKYWAETFTVCHIETNIHAFEPGDYVIKDISQKSPTADFVVTKLTMIQYERPGETAQTYHTSLTVNPKNTAYMNAQTNEILKMANHAQTCSCNADTPANECTAGTNLEVSQIQKHLQQWGYFPSYINSVGKVNANGRFCYHTTQALKNFQKDRGIEVTGAFDSKTKEEFIKKLEGI